MSATIKTPNLIAEETSAVLFDYRLVRDWVQYVSHSVGRHPLVAILCLMLIGGTTLFAALALPRQYEARTRMLSNQGLLSAANAYGGPADDLPAIAAVERIMSRDSLEKIVEQLSLVEGWKKRRSPLFRAKDKVMQK